MGLNGADWPKFAHKGQNNLKNRFFSLLSKHFGIPILEIKEKINYTDPKMLLEVIKNLQ